MLDLAGFPGSSSSDCPMPFLPAAIATASFTFCCELAPLPRVAAPLPSCDLTDDLVGLSLSTVTGELGRLLEPAAAQRWVAEDCSIDQYFEFNRLCLKLSIQQHTVQARSQPSNKRGVVFLRFRTFLGFEHWSSQWLSRGNLDFYNPIPPPWQRACSSIKSLSYTVFEWG